MRSVLVGAICLFAAGLASAQQPRMLAPEVTVVDSKGSATAGVKLLAIAVRGGIGSVVASGLTDRQGRLDFKLVKLESGQAISEVMATAPGCGIGFAHVRPDTPDCSITLTPPSKAVVHLVAPDGYPAVGVRVYARRFMRGRGIGNLDYLFLPGLDELTPSGVTNSAGDAIVDRLPADSAIGFEVKDTRFAQLSREEDIESGAPGTTAVGTFELRPGATMEGRIMDAGKPVSGVRVVARSIAQAVGASGVSATDGRFRLAQLLAGTYDVELILPAKLASEKAAIAHAGVTLASGSHLKGLDFSLIRGGVVTGTVHTTDGTPVVGTVISVFGPAYPRSGGYSPTVLTDSDGRFSVRVPAGEQVVFAQLVSPSATQQVHKAALVNEGKTVAVNFEVAPPPKTTIVLVAGTVRDTLAQPVSGASVEPEPDGSTVEPYGNTLTDGVGHFVVRLKKDAFPVRLRARKGMMGTTASVVVREPGAVDLVLKPDALATVTGRVLDARGKPVGGAQVQASEWFGHMAWGAQSAQTDPQGNYRIAGQWPDVKFLLDVRARGYGVAQPNFDEPGSRTIQAPPIDLPFGDSFVEGRVVDEKGRALAGVSVMADPYSQQPVLTDREGKFRVNSIPNGPVSIRLQRGTDFMERPAVTGKDQLYVLKSEPTIATPGIVPTRIAAGAKAIELKTDGWVNAQTTTLLSLRGKIVVLDFWAIWCGPCVRELPHVEALAKRFAGKPVVVIGIHDGTAVPQELVQFAMKKGLSYALAIDRKATTGFGVTANAYGIQGIPTMVVIDRNGKVFDLPAGADEAANVVAKLLQQ